MVDGKVREVLKAIPWWIYFAWGFCFGILLNIILREIGLSSIERTLFWGGTIAITLTVIGILAHREAKANA